MTDKCSEQLRDMSIAAFVLMFWIIWLMRNKLYFINTKLSLYQTLSMVKADIALFGSVSKESMHNSITPSIFF